MPLTNTGQEDQPNPQKTTTQSGSKGVLVVLGVVVAIILGLCFAFRTGVISVPSWLMKAVPESMAPALTSLTSEEATFGLMMQTNKPGFCTITSKTEGTEMTFFMSGEKLRIETVNTENGAPVMSYIVNDGEYQYHWTDQDAQGTMIKMPTKEEVEAMQEEATGLIDKYDSKKGLSDYVTDLEKDETEYEVKCQLQNVPASFFEVPTDIEFVEFNDLGGFQFDSDYQVEELDEAYLEELNVENLEECAQEMQEKYKER